MTDACHRPGNGVPPLRTERLILRARTLDDLEACLAMDRDPEVTRHIPGPWGDPLAHRRFVLDRITRGYPPGHGYWVLAEAREPARFLGWVLLLPVEGSEAPEIGWRLVRDARGQGYASEAAACVVRHAFDTVQVPALIADIAVDNAASLKLARKLGMRALDVVEDEYGSWLRHRLDAPGAACSP
ncbi:GNAT family N-acetyltransferase [Burkholderia gladioli]|uniref:GNAT family N-acetyltransferase n=1 Tax=Burkholderia gladioli TaxID=28095 RepID=UPI0016421F08|nr:GNAT family N-acetyltransferase [Burkholderia gladioli]